jgi:hypothetical protein
MDLYLRRINSSGIGRNIAAKMPADKFSFAVCFTLVIVSEVVAEVPFVSVTWAGAKLHVAPAGRPEQENITGPASPHLEVTCKLRGEEVAPLVKVRLPAEGVSVRSTSLA